MIVSPVTDYGTRVSRWYAVAKRFGDMVVSSLSLFVLAPLLFVLSLMIFVHDGGPPVYVSWRVGKNGKLIRFYKFRSMTLDAEQHKAELLKHNERADGPLFKMRNDPRVTRIGRRLRKYSLDEIPQLISVLAGDMSIVGPRPHLPKEVDHYSRLDASRLTVVPGVTCFPQVTRRNSIGFREWIDLDLEYCSNATVMLDIYIIGRTAAVVLNPIIDRLRGSRNEVF